MHLRTLQVRGYCSKRGYALLDHRLSDLCRLGNAALQERRDAWKFQRQGISYYDQCKSLTEVREDDPEGFGTLDVGIARGALRRIDRAFQAFFRRVKQKEKPGYPRFRSRRRYHCIELNDTRSGQVRQNGKHVDIRIKGLPRIRLQNTTVPDAKPRSIRIVRRLRGCTVDLVYHHEPEPKAETHTAVGIDLGVRKRATFSTGETFAPDHDDWKAIRRYQRRVSRAKRGSRNRRKKVRQLAAIRRRQAVSRRNSVHRITSSIIERFDTIAIEDLKVRNMTASARGSTDHPGRNVPQKAGLNRSILEQGWALFRQQLVYKAAWAGRRLVANDPRYTSQDCSECGHRRETPDGRERWTCSKCGTVHDRDVNAAKNILRAGILALASPSGGRAAA